MNLNKKKNTDLLFFEKSSFEIQRKKLMPLSLFEKLEQPMISFFWKN